MTKAILIPPDGPPEDVELDGTPGQLEQLVYGRPPDAPERIRRVRPLEAVILYEEPHREPSEPHGFTDEHARPGRILAYMPAQGHGHQENERATNLLADDLYPFDKVRGNLLLTGMDPAGGHIDLPERAREFEALTS